MSRKKPVPGARQRAARLKSRGKRNSHGERECLTKWTYGNGTVTLKSDGSCEWVPNVESAAEGEATTAPITPTVPTSTAKDPRSE